MDLHHSFWPFDPQFYEILYVPRIWRVRTSFVDKFPGLNGLGVSMARANIALGGVVPMHTHPGSLEIILIAKGSVIAGLISSDNTVYLKTLKDEVIMVFPQGLLYFHVNTDQTRTLFWVIFCSSNLDLQILNNALFGNNLPSELIENTTFLDEMKWRDSRLFLVVLGDSAWQELVNFLSPSH